MALQNARLAEIQFIGSSAAAVYTNPSSTKTYLRGMIVHNTNTTDEVVVFHMVPDASGSAGTASAATQFLRITLALSETVFFEFPYPLMLIDANETFQALTTTASKVTLLLLGDKE